MKKVKRTSTVARSTALRRRSSAAAMEKVTRLSNGFVLFREPRRDNVNLKSSESAAVLLKKLGRALAKPGISRSAIFPHGQPGLFAYSICPKNPKKIIRESSNGKRTLGRFVGGRFKAI